MYALFVTKAFALFKGHLGRGKNEDVPGVLAAKVARGASLPPVCVCVCAWVDMIE